MSNYTMPDGMAQALWATAVRNTPEDFVQTAAQHPAEYAELIVRNRKHFLRIAQQSPDEFSHLPITVIERLATDATREFILLMSAMPEDRKGTLLAELGQQVEKTERAEEMKARAQESLQANMQAILERLWGTLLETPCGDPDCPVHGDGRSRRSRV